MGHLNSVVYDFYIHHQFQCDHCRKRFTILESPSRNKKITHEESIPCPHCKEKHAMTVSGAVVGVKNY